MEVLYPRCAGLDVHKESVVACIRIASGGEVVTEVQTFNTTTASLVSLAASTSGSEFPTRTGAARAWSDGHFTASDIIPGAAWSTALTGSPFATPP